MELLFLILKIILIVFFSVLGVILFLIGFVLLVPIRYEVSGSIGDSWDIKLKGKISYCFSILKVIFLYEGGETDLQLFIFGRQKKQKEIETEIDADVNENTDNDESADIEAITEEDIVEERRESETSESVNDTIAGMETEVDENQQGQSQRSKAANAKSKKRKKKKRKEATENSSEKSKFDFAFWKQQITDEHNHSVLKKIWLELEYLLKHFGFRKIQTDLYFSTGDPATTGQILGVLCIVPILYQYEFGITPDFEADYFYVKGTFLIEGRLRLIHVLITALRLIFDKEVRLVIKRVLSMLE